MGVILPASFVNGSLEKYYAKCGMCFCGAPMARIDRTQFGRETDAVNAGQWRDAMTIWVGSLVALLLAYGGITGKKKNPERYEAHAFGNSTC